MGSFVSYIVVSSVALLAMWVTYRWLLADGSRHSFNRFVLLSIYGVALIFPALASVRIGGGTQVTDIAIGQITATLADVTPVTDSVRWPLVAVAVYFAGVVVMTALTVVSWVRLSRIVSAGQHISGRGYTIILTDDTSLSPFSWLGYIVMSRADYESDGDVIITHELKHLSLAHPVDMLVAQAFVIVQWFNPAAWLMRVELRAVHEYQADMAVLDSGFNARDYQLLLIKKAVGRKFPSLANSLNHSKLKKRITMMLNSKMSPSRRVRALAMVPALAVALVAVNLPFVSNAMSDLSEVTLPGKVTKNSETPEAAETKGKVISIVAEKQSPAESPENEKVVSSESLKKSVENGEVEIIIDGKKADSFDDIKPDQIQSITVLKDKEPTQIIITTKKQGESDNEQSLKIEGEPLRVVGYATQRKKDAVYDAVEEMPQFPGGEAALMQHLAMNIRYPKSEMGEDKPDKSRVIVKFIIDKTGHVSDPEIVRSGGEALDAEAVRVVSTIPDFVPGKINGQPVATTYTLPIVFQKQ